MSNNNARPKFGFSKMSVEIFVVFVQGVITALTGNSNFPSVVPSLTLLQTTLDGLVEVMVQASVTRSKILIAERNAKRDLLESMMKELAGHLMSVTSEYDVLITSGMEITQARGPVEPVTEPLSLTYAIPFGISGSLLLKWKQPESKNASAYLIEQTAGDPNDPATVWTIIGNSRKCRYDVTGLTPGSTYSWRTYGIGALGAGAKSLSVSAMAV